MGLGIMWVMKLRKREREREKERNAPKSKRIKVPD